MNFKYQIFLILFVLLNHSISFSQDRRCHSFLMNSVSITQSKMEFTIPLVLSEECVSKYMGPNKVGLFCTFDLGQSLTPPFSHSLNADGDLYFHYDYSIKGHLLELVFIYNAWLDAPNLIPGDEIKFRNEVFQHFSNLRLNLFLQITSPR